jgi:hypothetical protein
MGLCFKTPADKVKFDLVASVVGFKEAARDFYEQNNKVRPPRVILEKLQNRSTENAGINSFMDFVKSDESEYLNLNPNDYINSIIQQNNKVASNSFVSEFSERLGVKANIISVAEAADMGFPTSKGFFHKGQVYLVEGKFTPDTVFHEFSHPIVKSMIKDNPELLDALYNQLKDTEYGAKIIANMEASNSYYKNLKNLPEFKEEAIVQALTYINANNIQADNKNWYGKILYQIKQFLRKLFGRSIDVKNLGVDTSLSDLVKMLNQENTFKFDLEYVSASDITMLEEETTNILNNINEAILEDIQNMTNDYYSFVKKISTMLRNEEFAWQNLGIDLVNEENKGPIQSLLRMLESITADAKTPTRVLIRQLQSLDPSIERDAKEVQMRVRAFVESLAEGDHILDIFSNKIEDMKAIKDLSPSDLSNFHAIAEYVDNWKRYLSQTSGQIERYEDNFDEASDFFQKLRSFRVKVNSLQNTIDEARLEFLTDILYPQMKDEYTRNQRQFEQQSKRLLDKGLTREYNILFLEHYGLTVEEYNKYKELERLEKSDNLTTNANINEPEMLAKLRLQLLRGYDITKASVRQLLEGQIDTAGLGKFLNSQLESYLLSQGKTEGTFFTFVDGALAEAAINSQNREIAWQEGLNKRLKKTSLKYAQFISEGKSGDYLGTEVNIGKSSSSSIQDPVTKQELTTHNFEDKVERQLLSNFTGWQYVGKELQHKVMIAKNNFLGKPTVENETAYWDAVEEYEEFQYLYMHQTYVPEVYAADKILKGSEGRMAKAARDAFFDEINKKQHVQQAARGGNPIAAAEVKKLWQDYKYLHSIYDRSGNLKTGNELVIAEKLSAYRDAMRPYYEWAHIPDEFQNAYNNFIAELDDSRNDDDTPEFPIGSIKRQNAINNWIRSNTIKEINPSWFEKRKALLEEQAKLLEPLSEKNKEIADLSPLYEELSKLISPALDENNIYDGTSVSKEVQKKVRDIHAKIEEIQMKLYTRSGLTKEQYYEWVELQNQRKKYGGFLTEADADLFEDYEKLAKEAAVELGIHPKDLKRIREISDILSTFGEREATDVYTDTFVELAKSNDITFDILARFCDKVGIDLDAQDRFETKHFDTLLLPHHYREFVVPMMEENPEFKEWFENNHFETTRVTTTITGDKALDTVFMRTNLWSYVNVPYDYLNGFSLKDENGSIVGLLELDGVPRVPNFNYRQRKIKDEFLTKEIFRDKEVEEIYKQSDGTLGKRKVLQLATKNNKGAWLPRDFKGLDAEGNPIDNGAIDNRFIEAKYKKMYEENYDLWDLLNYTTNTYLDMQEGMPMHARRHLTFPAVRKSGVEDKFSDVGYLYNVRALRQEGGWKGAIKGLHTSRLVESVKNLFRTQSDDAEIDMMQRSGIDRESITRYDNLNRPITGTYDDIDINELSKDIFKTMFLYSNSVELFKSMSKINGFGRSLQLQLQNANQKDRKVHTQSKIVSLYSEDKNSSQRAEIVKNIIEKFLLNQQLKGSTDGAVPFTRGYLGKAAVRKTTNQLVSAFSRLNSFLFFALNPVATFTNTGDFYQKAIVQKSGDPRLPGTINYLNSADRTNEALRELLTYSYSSKQRPDILYLINVMDASPDRLSRVIGDAASRNVLQDILNGNTIYSHRRLAALYNELGGFFALLDKYKVKVKGVPGKHNLADLIYIKDGKINTHPDIDENFSITYDAKGNVVLGKSLVKLRRLHKAYLQKLTGMSGSMTESEFVSRHIMGKVMFSLMKFIVPLFSDDWGFKLNVRKNIVTNKPLISMSRRMNYGTGEREFGVTMGALNTVRKAFNTGFRGVTKQDLGYAIQHLMYYVSTIVTGVLAGMFIFNQFDEDEDELNNLIKERDRTLPGKEYDRLNALVNQKLEYIRAKKALGMDQAETYDLFTMSLEKYFTGNDPYIRKPGEFTVGGDMFSTESGVLRNLKGTTRLPRIPFLSNNQLTKSERKKYFELLDKLEDNPQYQFTSDEKRFYNFIQAKVNTQDKFQTANELAPFTLFDESYENGVYKPGFTKGVDDDWEKMILLRLLVRHERGMSSTNILPFARNKYEQWTGSKAPTPLFPYFETNTGIVSIVTDMVGLNSPITDGSYTNLAKLAYYAFADEETRKPKSDLGPLGFQRKDTGDLYYHYLFKQFGGGGLASVLDPAMGLKNEALVTKH